MPSQRSLWAMLAFLLGSAVLITVLGKFFLIPGLDAAGDASAVEKRQLSAYAMLLLAVVLLLVIVGMIMTFRVRRFFLPKSSHGPTQHVDAWAESGRRAQTLPEDRDAGS